MVSGRPADLVGADSMVGLLINTVPVRASITAATTTADLLDQLQSAHNDTEHQHLALTEIHRVTGHRRLFDAVFVYENYPTYVAASSGIDGLAVTELTNPPPPLPADDPSRAGPRTDLRVEIEHVTERVKKKKKNAKTHPPPAFVPRIVKLGYISPFKFANVDAINPSYTIDFWHLAYFLGFTFLLTALAWRVYRRKDIYT